MHPIIVSGNVGKHRNTPTNYSRNSVNSPRRNFGEIAAFDRCVVRISRIRCSAIDHYKVSRKRTHTHTHMHCVCASCEEPLAEPLPFEQAGSERRNGRKRYINGNSVRKQANFLRVFATAAAAASTTFTFVG